MKLSLIKKKLLSLTSIMFTATNHHEECLQLQITMKYLSPLKQDNIPTEINKKSLGQKMLLSKYTKFQWCLAVAYQKQELV